MAIEYAPKPNNVEQNEKIDLRILVAEDDPTIRAILKAFLDPKYSSVEFVENGQLLIDRFSTGDHNIDFIITDNSMPNMNDGLKAIEEIRRMGVSIPIIMVSSDAGPLKTDVEAIPGTAFLSKPFRRDELYKIIERMRAK